MPPWYVEKNIGIQHYKDDPSLSARTSSRRSPSGSTPARRREIPRTCRPARSFQSLDTWNIGQPDLVIKTEELVVKANAPDWWGEIKSVPTDLTEDRYVTALQVREVNDVPKDGSGRATVGGRYVFHHMIWARACSANGRRSERTDGPRRSGGGTSWPVHEVGRNADFFDPEGAPAARRRLGARDRIPSTCTRTDATRKRTSKSASSSRRRATSRRTATRPVDAWQRRGHRHPSDGSQPAAARLRRGAGRT